MIGLWARVTLVAALAVLSHSQDLGDGELIYRCPQHWIKFQESCYRFIKSPLRARQDARKNCQAYQSDLVSIDSLEEHGFLMYQLLWQDPQHRRWYTGARQQGGYWSNEGDGTQLTNMDNAFLPEPMDNVQGKDYLVYSFSYNLKRWGFEKVTGREELLYICEASIVSMHNLLQDDRNYQYGIEIDNPLKVPRGPYFIKQPQDVVFDMSKRKISNDVTISCLAGGYPTPTYEWFMESYENDRLVAIKIDSLTNSRYTVSGGSLIIYEPDQVVTHYLAKSRPVYHIYLYGTERFSCY